MTGRPRPQGFRVTAGEHVPVHDLAAGVQTILPTKFWPEAAG